MTRITKYSGGMPVIQRDRIKDAAAALAAYEEMGLTPEEIMDGKLLTGWIPVEERLPKPHVDVLVSLMDFGEDTSTFIDCLVYNNGRLTWSTYNGAADKVVAWIPLPEPYQG
ncbi:MAG: DUF551 domain-containing protein [Lachnospiraceae bacterium]